MRSIKARFEYRRKNNPYWSTWVCFADAIMEQGFSKDSIKEHFNKLVDKSDYLQEEKMQLLKYLYQLSKPLRSGQKAPKFYF